MQNIKWTKFWTRNFGLFRYYIYIESNKLLFYKKNFGKIFDYALTVPDGNLVGYYHDEVELKDITERMFKVACKDAKTFERFSGQVLGWMKKFISYNQNFDINSLADISDKKMLAKFEQWYAKYLLWQTGIYYFFVLEPIITQKFTEALKQYLQAKGNESSFALLSQVIMSPEKMNAVNLEHLSALETAIKAKNHPKEKNKYIEAHYKKFLWLPCYDIHHEPFSVSHFEEEIGKLMKKPATSLQKEIKETQKDFTSRKPAFKKVLSSIKDKGLSELSKIMNSLVYYKDLRDDLRRQTSFASKGFMGSLAARFSLTLEEINFLTPPEVRGLFKGKNISRVVIRQRIPTKWVLLSTPDKIRLFEGSGVQKILSKELRIGKADDNKFISGMIASKGLVKGTVRIVRHSVALNRVKVGDILVALTTHPEYIQAMKRAAAFVTDEGGLTSHAAIVSRELHKPCIVGTKTATHFLKDGDTVEVDADHGMV